MYIYLMSSVFISIVESCKVKKKILIPKYKYLITFLGSWPKLCNTILQFSEEGNQIFPQEPANSGLSMQNFVAFWNESLHLSTGVVWRLKI